MRLYPDTLSVVRQTGERRDGVRCAVSRTTITTQKADFPLEEGDTFERKLPTGVTEYFRVLNSGYQSAFGGIPAHYQAKIEKTTTLPSVNATRSVYNISGPGARVNIGSVDRSVNVVNVSTMELFARIREALADGAPAEVCARLDELEAARGTPDALSAYQRFISAAANHMTVLAPFLPALTQVLG